MRSSVRRLEQTYADQVDFHILNVDLISTRDLAIQYQVSVIPRIVLLDAQGNVVESFIGYQEEDVLIAAVERLVAAGR